MIESPSIVFFLTAAGTELRATALDHWPSPSRPQGVLDGVTMVTTFVKDVTRSSIVALSFQSQSFAVSPVCMIAAMWPSLLSPLSGPSPLPGRWTSTVGTLIRLRWAAPLPSSLHPPPFHPALPRLSWQSVPLFLSAVSMETSCSRLFPATSSGGELV